ncbi:hypothetical protein GQ55_3G355600 [Panicum hallii var. hallii]|uniref:Stigma-specific STIG1-like protein 4 n=2 Tax=Panicum sect. Panicum TaxID=2100772 RepID=A0A3L6RDA4_PANMI|nr:hypothetical protein GQ55_3G355600 [Panicum hallii var. hallii]RLN00613.1 stigma-specific STIG1-like protein 4 [Panicum miliaceum]
MAKLTILLVALLLAAATVSTAYATIIPGPKARRSRFLLANRAVYSTPLPSYDCSKKTAAVCLAPGSPGPACCDGQCVDTVASADHCGGCNKICKHGRICCGGRCVDLLADKDNCGKCFNQCNNKCTYGFCDYAQ